MTIRDQVLKAFHFLFEQFGFAFESSDCEDGEMIVIAESGLVRLRFIQDRADFFLDVSSSMTPERWMSLYDLLDEMKRKGLVSESYKYSNRVNVLSSVLKKNFSAVREYISKKGSPIRGSGQTQKSSPFR